MRSGKVRASGPFSHPILAGTVGATMFPLIMSIWQQFRRFAVFGLTACVMIVVCSGSSAPIVAMAAGICSLALWRWRLHIRLVKWGLIFAMLGLHMVMKAPVWDLISRIDFTGGSTGWHRSELITQAISHLGDWWFVGTDYTRDWMPYGITWSADHVDITNYYIKMGVIGGLPLLLGFIGIIGISFRQLGRKMTILQSNHGDVFMLWCVGSASFAHCINSLSVSYFDQTYVLPWLLIGISNFIAIRNINSIGDSPAETIAISGELQMQ
jgi:hypothetical protein